MSVINIILLKGRSVFEDGGGWPQSNSRQIITLISVSALSVIKIILLKERGQNLKTQRKKNFVNKLPGKRRQLHKEEVTSGVRAEERGRCMPGTLEKMLSTSHKDKI